MFTPGHLQSGFATDEEHLVHGAPCLRVGDRSMTIQNQIRARLAKGNNKSISLANIYLAQELGSHGA